MVDHHTKRSSARSSASAPDLPEEPELSPKATNDPSERMRHAEESPPQRRPRNRSRAGPPSGQTHCSPSRQATRSSESPSYGQTPRRWPRNRSRLGSCPSGRKNHLPRRSSTRPNGSPRRGSRPRKRRRSPSRPALPSDQNYCLPRRPAIRPRGVPGCDVVPRRRRRQPAWPPRRLAVKIIAPGNDFAGIKWNRLRAGRRG